MVRKFLTAQHGTGKELSDLLRDELGIPPCVQWFEVRFAIGEAVTVRCEYVAEEPDREVKRG